MFVFAPVIIYFTSLITFDFLRLTCFCFHLPILFVGCDCIVSGLVSLVFTSGSISFWASFCDPVSLFLKVCAGYRGRGGWQPGPEIIWLLLKHDASWSV